eukprot:m.29240 g.29240  ORF g.29240 m.29240 type:complete len:58 (+) comp9552_c0_seq1:1697-1870(+)
MCACNWQSIYSFTHVLEVLVCNHFTVMFTVQHTAIFSLQYVSNPSLMTFENVFPQLW